MVTLTLPNSRHRMHTALVSSHGFVDGNKRTAWVAARLFLLDNGYRMKFDPFDAIRAVEGLASNKMSEADFAKWIRMRLVL